MRVSLRELPRLPERLVAVAEAVLCGRAQIRDWRRKAAVCGRVARRMATAPSGAVAPSRGTT